MDIKYFGAGQDIRHYEMRSMKIDPAHREHQADLVMSRWFDYSNLHPAQTTYLYAHLYQAQTAKFYEAFIDARTVEKARAFVPNDIFMSRDMTSMWLARAAADALGVPYDFVLQFAQARAFDRTYKSFPRPNQLYGEEFELDLAVAWKESLGCSLRYSRLPRYRVSNFVKTRPQKAHIQFVVDQIKGRALPHVNLLARMFVEDILTPVLVANHFPEATIAEAENAAVRLALSHR